MTTLPVILVAVGGSDECMHAVSYISRILSPNQIGIESFHVRAELPETVFDLDGVQAAPAYEAEIGNWIDQEGIQMHDFMDKAKKVFTGAGFSPDAVHATIRKGFKNVSRLFSRSLEENLLCHIIRPLSVPHPVTCTNFSSKTEAHWLDEHSRRIIPAMVDMKQHLGNIGFISDTFQTTVLKRKIGRAEAIVGEADAQAFGTIRVGRHGATAVDEFTMGRVPAKFLVWH